MKEREFIEKYKNSKFTIEVSEIGDLSNYNVFAGDRLLNKDEEDCFWNNYMFMKTIYEDKNKEIVVW